MENPDSEEGLVITTSIYPIYYFASEIVQDRGHVVNLTPGGVEPHDYELTPYDLQRIESSDLVVVNGFFEPWLEDLEPTFQKKSIPVLVLTDSMDLLKDETEAEFSKDPHVWLDPSLAENIVTQLTTALQAEDPENAKFFQTHADELLEKLQSLDESFRGQLQGCAQDTFVTSHAAFAYLARRYGLNQMAIAGLSPDSDPSLQGISEIVDFVRAHDVKVIFFESLVTPKLSETVANETGAQTLVLNPIEGLTEQELVAGKNYFTEMEANLKNLKLALECP